MCAHQCVASMHTIMVLWRRTCANLCLIACPDLVLTSRFWQLLPTYKQDDLAWSIIFLISSTSISTSVGGYLLPRALFRHCICRAKRYCIRCGNQCPKRSTALLHCITLNWMCKRMHSCCIWSCTHVLYLLLVGICPRSWEWIIGFIAPNSCIPAVSAMLVQ